MKMGVIRMVPEENECVDLRTMESLKTNGFLKIESREELRNIPSGIVIKAPVDFLIPNLEQPREYFDPVKINEIAASIEVEGDVKTPICITIRCSEHRGYHLLIIEGERRSRAIYQINLLGDKKIDYVSCLVFPEMTDDEVYLMSCQANEGREPLTAIEEAKTYFKMIDKFGMTQDQEAVFVSKSPSHISSMLKYLKLNPDIQELVTRGELSKGLGLVVAILQPEHQVRGLNYLNKLVGKLKAKGKGLHPNDATYYLRKWAEKENITLVQPKKQGAKIKDPLILLVSKIERLCVNLNVSLEDLATTFEGKLGNLTYDLLAELLDTLNDTAKSTKKQAERIDEII